MNGILWQSDFQFLEVFRTLFNQLAGSIDNILGALAIAIIGWIISKISARVIRKLLSKLKIDKVGEKLNEIDIVNKANVKIVPSIIISKFIYYVLLLIFFMAAAEVLGMPAVSNLITDIINFVPNLITALIVLILGVLLAEVIRNLVFTTSKSLNIPSARIISTLIFYFIFINIVIMALAQAGVNTDFISSNLTLLIGGIVLAFAIGYGLASRGQMANFMASMYTKDRFRIGDIISVDGIKGEIIDIDRTSVTVRSKEGRVILPLSKLASEKVEIFNN